MLVDKNYGIVGIDYSMSCPSACYHPIDVPFSIEHCSWIFLNKDKKFTGFFLDGRIKGVLLPEVFKSEDERYDFISETFMDLCSCSEIIGLEGYSFGSSAGRVFQIAENTAVLKHKLWKQREHQLHIIPPKTVKKFATGNGNADKNLMNKHFIMETNIELTSVFPYNKIPKNIGSPISDLVDSYFICKYIYLNFVNKPVIF